ncbi:PQQ-dependent sugar dehydrogenase [Leptospira johnsonii]|uniref:Glucose/sorbosone dehydrogenase n=1 Tax=Leptospira johnsonii TaxID=1917820 RepID=A0A2P2CZJ6_9LEPT|nr:PQQ-dependent sugar dehydrogenase [Leptospira johnsonii]GBF37765.1 glucose/sorbosone dehydrogenase [Leptospira johnsonii]
MRRFCNRILLVFSLFLGLSLFTGEDTHLLAKTKKQKPKKETGTEYVFGWTQIASGFKEITDIQFHPSLPGEMLVLEKKGKILLWNFTNKQSKLIADFTGSVETRSEEGLLGFAFHPKFSENRLFYINAVSKEAGKDQTFILEFHWDDSKILRWQDRKRILLRVDQPYSNHNAGQLSFGPDGKLYIGFGDGGAAGDPYKHGQNTSTYLGTLIRITPNLDANAPPYKIPEDNPFKNSPGFLPEIWAYGFRNPWKFSFDTKTGDLYLADVGQDDWEEVDLVLKGKNYGWNIKEGFHCFLPKKDCEKPGLTDPILEYDHDLDRSITGGYVYRGKNLSKYYGWYIFADFVSGKILGFSTEVEGKRKLTVLGDTHFLISTFGQDSTGELYFSDFSSGNIFQIGKKN